MPGCSRLRKSRSLSLHASGAFEVLRAENLHRTEHIILQPHRTPDDALPTRAHRLQNIPAGHDTAFHHDFPTQEAA
jgi:hypothetical protein